MFKSKEPTIGASKSPNIIKSNSTSLITPSKEFYINLPRLNSTNQNYLIYLQLNLIKFNLL